MLRRGLTAASFVAVATTTTTTNTSKRFYAIGKPTPSLLQQQNSPKQAQAPRVDDENDPLMLRYMQNRQKWSKASFKATFFNTYAVQAMGVAFIMVVGIATAVGPYLMNQMSEANGALLMERSLKDASALPTASKEWWDNEWMLGRTIWKNKKENFMTRMEPFDYVAQVCDAESGDGSGRDPLDISTFMSEKDRKMYLEQKKILDEEGEKAIKEFMDTISATSDNAFMSDTYWKKKERVNKLHELQDSPLKSEKYVAALEKIDKVRPRVLVPMCGDDQEIRKLMSAGWFIDAVDGSQFAIRRLAEQLEPGSNAEMLSRTHLHYEDIFTPAFWRVETEDSEGNKKVDTSKLRGVDSNGLKKYDFIYDHLGISSLPLDRREDYAYLLKRALNENGGVLYLDGIFRTGRVAGNKKRGPPYQLREPAVHKLFPASDGFVVKCMNKQDAAIEHITKQARLLGTIPVDLHYTEFPCVVTKAPKEPKGQQHEESPKKKGWW